MAVKKSEGLWPPTSPSLTVKNDVRDTLEQRDTIYGDYTQNAACAMDTLGVWMIQPSWHRLDPVKRHALTMVAIKVARILSGDPNCKDSWHDIAGYATLAEDRCD